MVTQQNWRVTGEFVDGQAQDIWRWYDAADRLRVEGRILDSRRTGWWTWLNESGHFASGGTFRRDRPLGMWQVQDAERPMRGYFNDGRMLSWWSSGREQDVEWQGFIHQGRALGWWYQRDQGWHWAGIPPSARVWQFQLSPGEAKLAAGWWSVVIDGDHQWWLRVEQDRPRFACLRHEAKDLGP